MTNSAALADSLANLAASLNSGKDKLGGDRFFIADLTRDQVDSMYRGDWLARKIVDIVPYDMVREWREWGGDARAVDRVEAAEKRFRFQKSVQRAMTLGRLYGGAAIIIGTAEKDPAALAEELRIDGVKEGDVKFLHVVNRWDIVPFDLNRDPLDSYFGEPTKYQVTSAARGSIDLHPSRVVRFLGNELPDPIAYSSGTGQGWGDSILQTALDAIHAVALTATGTASLVHEAKTDVITVPGLSEHLATQATTDQLTKRFSYATMMKSINNLLLLGDGEEWNRQQISFAHLPDVLRLFLQVAAGAADIPVTRLLGQSPAGMSATGESDTRNYYDMLSSRQEVDLRPQLERLDEALIRSAGVDPSDVSFEFRPLWQMTEAEKADIHLKKAQATAIYATNALLPEPVLQEAVQEQLIEDGVYPNLQTIVEEFEAENPDWEEEQQAAQQEAVVARAQQSADAFDPDQPRGPDGKWTASQIDRVFEAVGQDRIERVSVALPTRLVAEQLSQMAGVDVSDFPFTITNQSLGHIFKGHGSSASEASRGQKPINRSDIAALPSILSAAHKVEPANPSRAGAKRALLRARIDAGAYTVTAEIQRAKKRIEIVTMWKR